MLELAQSVEREGIIQPIVVSGSRPATIKLLQASGVGERASLVGLTEVPVIVREADDHKVLELAIVENIQREDLNPIELAKAFERWRRNLRSAMKKSVKKRAKTEPLSLMLFVFYSFRSRCRIWSLPGF